MSKSDEVVFSAAMTSSGILVGVAGVLVTETRHATDVVVLNALWYLSWGAGVLNLLAVAMALIASTRILKGGKKFMVNSIEGFLLFIFLALMPIGLLIFLMNTI